MMQKIEASRTGTSAGNFRSANLGFDKLRPA